MFTGIVQDVGRVLAVENRARDCRLRFSVRDGFLDDCRNGDSIAVSGACLTVIEHDARTFAADVSAETLECTTMASWQADTGVNLERALALGDRLDGHLVTGHVDTTTVLLDRRTDGTSLRLRFRLPEAYRHLVAAKGSVALDGVSLTVNACDTDSFSVNIIPHTMQNTTLGSLETGHRVNLEIDLMARYAARLSQTRNERE